MPISAPKPVPAGQILDPDFWIRFCRTRAESLLSSLIEIAAILFAYALIRALCYRLIDSLIARISAREERLGIREERSGRLQTLSGLAKSLISYVLFFIFGVLVLKAVGFDIMPFITTAGVIGLAIGFGSQKLVKDVISGFFIIVDNLFVVGETISIGTVTGQVSEMGMRVTRLEDRSGRTYIFANGDIGTITNLSRHPVQDFIEVSLGATSDLNSAIQIMNDAGSKIHASDDDAIITAPRVIGITAFTATTVTVKMSLECDPTHLERLQMQLRQAVRDGLIAGKMPLA